MAEGRRSERWPGQVMSKFLWIIVRTLEFILGEMESRRVTAADS